MTMPGFSAKNPLPSALDPSAVTTCNRTVADLTRATAAGEIFSGKGG